MTQNTMEKRRKLPATPNILIPIYDNLQTPKIPSADTFIFQYEPTKVALASPDTFTSTKNSDPFYTKSPATRSHFDYKIKELTQKSIMTSNISETILHKNKHSRPLKSMASLDNQHPNNNNSKSSIKNVKNGPFSTTGGNHVCIDEFIDDIETRRHTVKRFLPSLEAVMKSGIENTRKARQQSIKSKTIDEQELGATIYNAEKPLALKDGMVKSNRSSNPLIPSYSHDKIYAKRFRASKPQVHKTRSENDVNHELISPETQLQKEPTVAIQPVSNLAKKRKHLLKSRTVKENEKEKSIMPPLYLRCNDQSKVEIPSPIDLPATPLLIESLAKLRISKKDYMRKSFRREKLYQRRRSSLNDLDNDMPNANSYLPFSASALPENCTRFVEVELNPSGIQNKPSFKNKNYSHICTSLSDSNESLQSIINGTKTLKNQFNARVLNNLKSKIGSQTILEDSDTRNSPENMINTSKANYSLSPEQESKINNMISVVNNTNKSPSSTILSNEDPTISPTSQINETGEPVHSHRQTDLGEIKFSVWYIPSLRELRINVIRAEHLIKPSSIFKILKNFKSLSSSPMDIEDEPSSNKAPTIKSFSSKRKIINNLNPNPFLEISFIHEKGKMTQESSDFKKHLNQSDPEFHDIFIFNSIDEDIIETSQLQIKVVHKSLSPLKRNELMGEVRLDLNSKDFIVEKRMWRELLPKIKKEVNGYLKIALRIDFVSKKLTVTVIQAKNLPKNLLTGPPDSFVTICLVENGVPSSQNKRTKEKRKASDPVYKEAFSLYFKAEDNDLSQSFETWKSYKDNKTKMLKHLNGHLSKIVGDEEKCKTSLQPTTYKTIKRKGQLAKTGVWFTVYNSNLLSKHMIGQVRLGYGSTEESEISQWREVIENPGVDITKWHYLMEA